MRFAIAALVLVTMATACYQPDNPQAQQSRSRGTIQFIYVMGNSAILLMDEWRGDCLVANKVSDGGKTRERTGCWDMNDQEDVVIIKWAGGVTEHHDWGNFRDYQDYLDHERHKRGWLN